QESLISNIQNSGAQVIREGDFLRIIIPIDQFFVLASTTLRPYKVEPVQNIAEFVKSYASYYSHPSIVVSGYTDKVFHLKSRTQLSRQYAEVIASYLWS